MKISRIDSDRNIDKDVCRLEIAVGTDMFTITEAFGELLVHANSGKKITIKPCVANEISISATDD